jgi:hypothetical protein
MKAFVDWVSERRYRLVLLAVAFTPVLPLVSVALLSLETIRRGAVQGCYSAIAGIVGIGMLGALSGSEPRMMLVLGAVTLIAGVALGVLVRLGQSLALPFQASLLFCVLAVIVANGLWPDPAVLIGGAIEQFVEVFRQNGATEEQLAIVRSWDSQIFGLFASALFTQLIAALLLGFWWSSLSGESGAFGKQFRALQLGRVLGIPATLLMASSLVLNAQLVQNLFPLVLLGFWFQGLAVSHAWAKAKGWHPVAMGAVYLSLVPPLTAMGILALGSVGLVDNWLDLRAPVRPIA